VAAGAGATPLGAPGRGVAGATAAGAVELDVELVPAALVPQAASVTVLAAASAAIRHGGRLGFCVG